MAQNIEKRTEIAVKTYEGSAKKVDELANDDGDVQTGSGPRKSFPKISREWSETSTRLSVEWENERNDLSVKSHGVKQWESGKEETNINQQRRWTDNHTYLPKMVPALMTAIGPDDNWIPYTADKSDTLADVFGNKPIVLLPGITIVPDSYGRYPKLNAMGKIWELSDSESPIVVTEFSESLNGDLVIKTDSGNYVIALHVSGATRYWVKYRDRTVNVLYLSDYGAKGDGVTFDDDAIEKAIMDANPYPNETASVNDIISVINAKPTVIMMSGLHRHARRIYLPAGVTFSHPGQAYFTQDVKIGLFYDPVDKDTAGVSSLVYKKHTDGLYRVYDDIYNIPTGYDFDEGRYIAATKSIALDFNIITAPDVTVGLFLLGAAGCYSSTLSIGENGKGDAARLPKVGMVMASCWGSYHEKPKILGRNQGLVTIGANGGSVFDTPYIDRNGSDDNELSKMVYKVEFGKEGSAGITTIGTTSLLFISPIVEHWYFPHVIGDDSDVKLIKPHIESYHAKMKHSYVVKRSRMEVDGVSISSAPSPDNDPDASIFHLVDCEDGVHEVFAYGNFPTLGYRMVTGVNSGKVLNLVDIGRPQLQYGRLGQIEFIGSISNRSQDMWVQLSPDTGDDENWGMHGQNPVRTLSAALKRAELFGTRRVQLLSPLTCGEEVQLRENLSIYGKRLSFSGSGAFVVSECDVDVKIYCEGLFGGDISPFVIKNGGEIKVTMTSSYQFYSKYAPVLFAGAGVATLILINADVTSFSTYAHSSLNESVAGMLSVYVKSPKRNRQADSTPAVNDVLVLGSKFQD